MNYSDLFFLASVAGLFLLIWQRAKGGSLPVKSVKKRTRVVSIASLHDIIIATCLDRSESYLRVGGSDPCPLCLCEVPGKGSGRNPGKADDCAHLGAGVQSLLSGPGASLFAA